MIGDAAKAHHVYGGVPELAIRQQPAGAQTVISAISESQWGGGRAYLGLSLSLTSCSAIACFARALDMSAPFLATFATQFFSTFAGRCVNIDPSAIPGMVRR